MLYNKELISQGVKFLKNQGIGKIDVSIILGSGLSEIASQYTPILIIPYHQIPGMKAALHVIGHESQLVYCKYNEKYVAFWQGRIHMYEGNTAFETVFPVALSGELGASSLIITNAAGGLNPDYNPGDIMMIEDHIKTQSFSPLEGIVTNDRFVDMQNAYDVDQYPQLNEKFHLKKGIYLSTLGPQYETPAEVRLFRQMGGDAIGMSTVMETIMARFYQMHVFGFSMITNKAAGMVGAVLDHSDVVENAAQKVEMLGQIIEHLLMSKTATL